MVSHAATSTQVHSSQHPQCEGVTEMTNRFPFRTETSDGPFIHGDQQLVLYAGKHSGATVGSLFDLHAYPSTSESFTRQKIARLEVTGVVGDGRVLLRRPPDVVVPVSFCAKLAGFDSSLRLRVYFTDRTLWGTLQTADKDEGLDKLEAFAREAYSVGEAVIVGTVEGNGTDRKVSFKWTKLVNAVDISVGDPIPVSDVKKLITVLVSASRFRYYLTLPQESSSDRLVDVSMARLKNARRPGLPYPIMDIESVIQPTGTDQDTFNLELAPGTAVKPMGVTLKNGSNDESFYPHVFLFKPGSLAIGECALNNDSNLLIP